MIQFMKFLHLLLTGPQEAQYDVACTNVVSCICSLETSILSNVKISHMLHSGPQKFKYNVYHLLHTCSSETSIGSLKRIQVTLSEQGGVVREPRYVQ
jgi:hypothetical protein